MMRGRRGFSLAEALIAFGLVVTTVIVLYRVFPTTRQGLQLSENHTNAATLGYGVLQSLRNEAFDTIAPSTGSREFKGVNNGAPFSQVINYAVSVEPVGSDRKRVWVTLTWREATGDKSVVVETLIAKTGN